MPASQLHLIISEYPLPKQPGTGIGINQKKPGALLFYNLSSYCRSEHLHGILKLYKAEYFLKWIDAESAVASFNDEATMKVAAYVASTNRNVTVKPITDSVNVCVEYALSEEQLPQLL